jgi:shikimate kinase/3-dehydroquinate synthase
MSPGDLPNLVLTGFMGTGKTAAGRELARRLGREFVDMDAEIEARAGKPVPRIFAEDGEPTFRQMEAALCAELSARQGLVVATGGGALVDAANRAAMMRTGTVVCLTCDPDEILRRVQSSRQVEGSRPATGHSGLTADDFGLPVDDSGLPVDDSGLPDLSGALSPAQPRQVEGSRPAAGHSGLPVDDSGLPDLSGALPAADRPLLNVADPRAEIERLLSARREAYAAIPWQLDTTGRSLEQVVERLLPLAGAVTLQVHHPGGAYPIHIGQGLLDHVGGALRAAGAPAASRVAIVSNPVVAPLYAARTEAALRRAGFQPLLCPIPDGEEHKTLATVAALYDQFLAGELDRGDTVLSLGGGVTGDVAGFAAATYLRGVRFAQVPTTLLAMADASTGGKTGVDLPQGKNLVGAFKQPALVLIDPIVLATLPAAEVRSGMAEVIKHAILADPDLFAELEPGPSNLQSPIPNPQYLLSNAHLARTLQVKIDVVERDPFEGHRRAVLNLGHTAGHALEQLSGYTLRHGEAVSIGIVVAAHIAAGLGRAEPALAARIEAALSAWGLPVRCPPFAVDAMWAAMAHDKKRRGRSLRWVLPLAIGQVEIAGDVLPEVVRAVLSGLGASEDERRRTNDQ